MRPAADEALVGLVGDHQQVPPGGEGHELPQVVRAHHAPRGIARRVDEDGPGALRHRRDEGAGVDLKAVLAAGGHHHGLRAGEADLRREGHPVGRGEHHLLAVVEDGEGELEEGGLAADRDHRVRGLPRRAVTPAVGVGHRGAQRGQAAAGGVAGEAFGEGAPGRLHRHRRGEEVGLARPQVHHRDTLGPQLGRTPGHPEGGGLTDGGGAG